MHHSHHEHHQMMVKEFKNRFWISLILTVPILLLSPLVQDISTFGTIFQFKSNSPMLFVLSSMIYFYGGQPFIKGLILELGAKTPGMMTLISIAITTAYLYSSATIFGLKGNPFFWELATLIDIMLLGHWIEMRSIMGAGTALEELVHLIPDMAHQIDVQGSIKDIPSSQLQKGMKCVVKPGEKIPGDGIILEGASTVNEALLTGESKPVSKKVGDQVIGGAINGEGSLIIQIQKASEEGFIYGVIKLVREAQSSKSKTQDIANQAAVMLTIIALGGGFLTFFFWLIATMQGIAFALERSVTVMITTCPHALGLAVPLVVAVSTSLAATHGLLIRNRAAFERARRIQAVVFDKTGTLTKGEFGVTDVVIYDQAFCENDILNLAGSLEQYSEHPIAKGIVKAAKHLNKAENFAAIPGQGAQGSVQGKSIKIVSPGYFKKSNTEINDPHINHLNTQGKTVIFVLIEEKIVGAIALADIIRPESKEAVRLLKQMGIQCMMLTGDHPQVARWVAKEIGLDDYFASVLPDQKSEKIKELQSQGLIVAMTGDGVNDAPALAQADVGIAIGAGTDVAVETADIILVKSNPLDVVAVLELAQSTYRKMIQNLLWATGYNVFVIPAAAGLFYGLGWVLTPALGAILMSLSTVICAINSRSLKLKS